MQPNAIVEVNTPSGRGARIGNGQRLSIIAGPCQLESRQHALETAQALREIADRLDIGLVYKTSFDKANRTSATAARGVGLREALPIFAEIREAVGLPVLTDVHEIEQCAVAAEAVDILQIPAFLCRQTDLIVAAARTGRAVNVKKGQFLAPWDMKNVIAKATATGNARRHHPLRARRLLRLQQPGGRHAGHRPDAAAGRAGDHRRHPRGAAPGRPGDQFRRPARVRSGAGQGGGGDGAAASSWNSIPSRTRRSATARAACL